MQIGGTHLIRRMKMGMLIDDCIEYMNTEYHYAINEDDMADEKDIEVLRTILEIVKKYQKIKEIVENNNGWTDSTLKHSRAFAKIVEVIEDGNDG